MNAFGKSTKNDPASAMSRAGCGQRQAQAPAQLAYACEDMRLVGAHVIGEQPTQVIHIGDLYKYATYDALSSARPQLICTGKRP